MPPMGVYDEATGNWHHDPTMNTGRFHAKKANKKRFHAKKAKAMRFQTPTMGPMDGPMDGTMPGMENWVDDSWV